MWDERATNLGKIIYRERKKKGLTQEELYRGICTQGELTKIESGDRVPDKMLADAMMQRLGRCTDTLEAIMSLEEYVLFDLREILQRHFFENDYERTKDLLEEYSRHKTVDQKLHQQFVSKYTAVNEYRKDGDIRRCLRALGEALAVTFPEWEGLELMKYRLCNQELHLLILIGYFTMPEDGERAVQILEAVAEYLEKRYYEEEKVKLFPQCMWLLACKGKREGEWEKVEEYSRRGVECLTKNGALPLLVELLEFRIESLGKVAKDAGGKSALVDVRDMSALKGKEAGAATKDVGDTSALRDAGDRSVLKDAEDESATKDVGDRAVTKEGVYVEECTNSRGENSESEKKGYIPEDAPENDVTVLSNQLESLKAVLRYFANWVLEMDDLSKLHYFYHEEDVSLDFEMLRDIRKNQGISQGDLESCTQGNLSRIENGKQSPSKRHVLEIASELGVDKSYYISRVQSDDYDLYELCHWRNQAIFDHEWDKAAEIVDKLNAVLDMDIPLNRQYIEICAIEDKRIREEANPEGGLQQLEKILRYTMPDYQEGKMRIPSREEFIILNQMAVFMRKTGKSEDGLELRRRMLKTFEESRVKVEYHTNSMLLLYMCYGEMLEADGQIELAEEIDICGIKMDVWCGQGGMTSKILTNLAYVYEKSDLPEKRALRGIYLWHSYQLCLLMKQAQLARIVAGCYQSLFGEDINASPGHHPQTGQPVQEPTDLHPDTSAS